MTRSEMTPQQKIKWAIITKASDSDDTFTQIEEITADNIDEIYEEFEDQLYDYLYEFREGEVETNVPPEYSRHYERSSVAAKMPDGTWVGWTYWYGGGKHGKPKAIDWMSDAYHLDCQEEEKMVVVRTFKKMEE
jgi:hypothetical protein